MVLSQWYSKCSRGGSEAKITCIWAINFSNTFVYKMFANYHEQNKMSSYHSLSLGSTTARDNFTLVTLRWPCKPTHEQITKLENNLFPKQKYTNCERTWCFLGRNSMILSVLWSYFAFWSQNRVVPGRRVVPSRAFTRRYGYPSARVTLPVSWGYPSARVTLAAL